jgi:hypothetical protein
MAEIKNYTVNFSCGCPAGLTGMSQSAFAEVYGKRTMWNT